MEVSSCLLISAGSFLSATRGSGPGSSTWGRPETSRGDGVWTGPRPLHGASAAAWDVEDCTVRRRPLATGCNDHGPRRNPVPDLRVLH